MPDGLLGGLMGSLGFGSVEAGLGGLGSFMSGISALAGTSNKRKEKQANRQGSEFNEDMLQGARDMGLPTSMQEFSGFFRPMRDQFGNTSGGVYGTDVNTGATFGAGQLPGQNPDVTPQSAPGAPGTSGAPAASPVQHSVGDIADYMQQVHPGKIGKFTKIMREAGIDPNNFTTEEFARAVDSTKAGAKYGGISYALLGELQRQDKTKLANQPKIGGVPYPGGNVFSTGGPAGKTPNYLGFGEREPGTGFFA